MFVIYSAIIILVVYVNPQICFIWFVKNGKDRLNREDPHFAVYIIECSDCKSKLSAHYKLGLWRIGIITNCQLKKYLLLPRMFSYSITTLLDVEPNYYSRHIKFKLTSIIPLMCKVTLTRVAKFMVSYLIPDISDFSNFLTCLYKSVPA